MLHFPFAHCLREKQPPTFHSIPEYLGTIYDPASPPATETGLEAGRCQDRHVKTAALGSIAQTCLSRAIKSELANADVWRWYFPCELGGEFR